MTDCIHGYLAAGGKFFCPACESVCERCFDTGEVPSVVGGTDEFGSQDQGYVPCPDCEDR